MREWRAALAAGQESYGYLTLVQLRALGFRRHHVQHLLRTGRLESAAHGIYRIGGHVNDWRSRLHLLTLQTGGCASHLSAAMLHQLGKPSDLSPGYAEVTTDRSRHTLRLPHRLYRTGRPVPQRVIRHIPCTTIDHTLLDIAAVHGISRFSACFNAAVRSRLTSRAQLEAAYEHDRLSRRIGNPGIRAALASVAGASVPLSEWSVWAADRLAAAGLPRPELEAVVRDDDGHPIAQVDLYWPAYGLVVELDGREYHFDSVSFERDRRRDALLAGRGITVIRVTWAQFRDGDYVERTVATALRRRGFAG